MSKAEKTRQYIIEKTAPIFNRKGYAGTSISDLTGATGLTKGSIYGNFENKDEVALAAFDYNFGMVAATVKRYMEAETTAAGKLQVYLTVFSDFANIPALHGGCPVLNTAIEADDTHSALRARAVSAIERWLANIENVIRQGQETGEIKPDISLKEFAGAFIALIEGGIMLAKLTGTNAGLKAALAQAGKMIDEITT